MSDRDKNFGLGSLVDDETYEAIRKGAGEVDSAFYGDDTFDKGVCVDDRHGMAWFQTFTGKRFYVLDPRPRDFDILDIAHSLSLLCRYNGHCKLFYSVAEHSILLAKYVLRRNPYWMTYGLPLSLKTAAMEMLMHDAVEAYLSDVPKPVKNSIPAWEQAEAEVERVLRKAFGLCPALPPHLKALDKRIIGDEKRALMLDFPWEKYDHLEPLGVEIKCLPPQDAEREFLHIYRELAQ